MSRGMVVLKLGGELLENAARTRAAARAIARVAAKVTLVVVHGGGKEIDAALAQASIPNHQVDGLRVTDDRTLQVVVSVLAGTINTQLVAAINAARGRAVGLTGADAGVGRVKPAPPHRATNGELVDLGLVGEPLDVPGVPLVQTLCRAGFVPVIACVGADANGRLFNVNADTMAGNLAARLKASRLVIAGGTAGVLDAHGATLASLDASAMSGMISAGTATAGMIAKLRACRQAMDGGVTDIIIVDGKSPRLVAVATGTAPRKGGWTRLK